MRLLKVIILAIILPILLMGCEGQGLKATGDFLGAIGSINEPVIKKEKTYQVSPDKLWSVLTLTAKELRWPIDQYDREKKIIKTQVQTLPLAKFNQWTQKNAYSSESPDCKEGRYHIELLLDDSDPNQARVNVNVIFEGFSCDQHSSLWKSCYSNGDVEKDILNRIEMNLAIANRK